MADSIIVALISGCVTLIGVIITQIAARNKTSNEIHTTQVLMNQRLDQTDKRLDEHNHYAKLYAENVPVLKEQLSSIKQRLEKLEGK